MGQSALSQNCKEAEVTALREALKLAHAEIEDGRARARRTQRASSELHHRLKNSFQLLCCSLQLQERSVRSTEAEGIIAAARRRIIAIGRVHAFLAGDDKATTVNFGDYVTDLCDAIATSLALRCDVSSGTFELDIGTAASIGIIVNELVINAAKHAQPRGDDDLAVRVAASCDPEGQLCITVSDNGQGMPPDFNIDQSKSLGLGIVKSTVAEIGGTLSIGHDNGAVFTIRVPPPVLPGRDKRIE